MIPFIGGEPTLNPRLVDLVGYALDRAWPCVFTRWLPVGKVRRHGLAQILDGSAVAQVRAMLGASGIRPVGLIRPGVR